MTAPAPPVLRNPVAVARDAVRTRPRLPTPAAPAPIYPCARPARGSEVSRSSPDHVLERNSASDFVTRFPHVRPVSAAATPNTHGQPSIARGTRAVTIA